MYTLIGSPKSRAFRVLWTLEELGQSYEIEAVRPHSETINKHNPAGKIPALIDGSDTVIDSVAIIQYLADKHNSITHPAGTIERAKQDSFTQFACDEMDGILWTMAKHTFVLPEHLRCEEVKTACRWDFERALRILEQRLGDNTYLTGASFTVPDVLVTHCANWASNNDIEIDSEALNLYFERVRSRQAYKKALAVRDAS